MGMDLRRKLKVKNGEKDACNCQSKTNFASAVVAALAPWLKVVDSLSQNAKPNGTASKRRRKRNAKTNSN